MMPEAVKVTLREVASLPQDVFDALLAKLRIASPSGHPATIARHLQKGVEQLDSGKTQEIVTTLFSLYAAKTKNRVPLSEFVDDILESVETPNSQNLKTRLTDLLEVKSIALGVKASEVQHSYSSVFVSARMLSDIRPIFTEEPERPLGSVIVHNLKITFQQDSEPREFFVALDDHDISVLQRVLNRAEVKAKTLRALLQSTELADIPTNEE
jgi:hypothetical protein